jgi:hypothetical protein
VPEGSEIRLRADVEGVYLFDSEGGRSLGAGQLAAWFEGRERRKVEARVRVRREYRSRRSLDAARDDTELRAEPGELVCSLLAEWTGHPREALTPRCQNGSLPPAFGFGPFSAELTAVVALHVPRYALRADDVDVPELPSFRSAVMLDEPALARFVPARAAPEVPKGPLEIENHTDTRAILILQGVPVAWIGPGEQLRIDGLPSGSYRAGAVRPLGILRMTPRLLEVPGKLSLGQPASR